MNIYFCIECKYRDGRYCTARHKEIKDLPNWCMSGERDPDKVIEGAFEGWTYD